MSMYPIANQIITTTGTNAAFINIPQNFTHLQIRVFSRDQNATGSTDPIYCRVNNDFGTNYATHNFYGSGSAVTFTSPLTSSTFGQLGINPSASYAANVYSSTIIDILDYTNTNKYKTIRSISGLDGNGTGSIGLWSTLWMNTSAITSIIIGGQNSNAFYYAGSRIDIYGITTA